MDNNRLAVGTTVHLPIYTPLGLFYVGDVHATMGDAEMCGSGVEIGARVPLDRLRDAMEDWFRRKSYLTKGARLVVEEAG